MMRLALPLLLATIASASAVAGIPPDDKNSANAVYFGGDILTIAGDQPEYVEALVVKDGYLAFVGDKESAMRHAGSSADLVILDANPLKIPRKNLIDLAVVKTISRGKTIYQRD